MPEQSKNRCKVLSLANHARRTGSWFSISGIIFLLLFSPSRLANASETIADARAAAGVNGAASEASSKPGIEGAGGEPIADETLLLDVRLNGNSVGKVGEFVKRQGTVMVKPLELRDLGLNIPDSLMPGSDGLIVMSEVRGLAWNLDEKNMVMNLTAGDNL